MKWTAIAGITAACALSILADRRFDIVGRMSTAATLVSGAVAAHTPSPPQPQPAVRKVRVMTPKPAARQLTLTLPGRTAPWEQARLSARAAGIVIERHGEIGDRVTSGETLVVIDAPETRQALERARAAVRQVESRLKLAEILLKRAEVLSSKDFLPQQTLDERRATAEGAKADLAAARAEVGRLEEITAFQTIKAPFNGTIISRNVERGDRVGGDNAPTANSLYSIARLEPLRVEIDIPQTMALKIKPGTPARVTFAEMHGRTFDAKVARTSQSVDAASSTMRAELAMDNPDVSLPAGLNGQVLLEVAREEACVQIPGNALIVQQGSQYVAVANAEDKIAFKPVGIDRDLGNEVEVCNGLEPADRVILSPNALLKQGDKVEIIPQ